MGSKSRKVVSILTVLFLAAIAPGIGARQPAQASPAVLAQPADQAGDQTGVEGRLVPALQVRLSSPMSGQVGEVLVQEGERVEAGAVLLVLADRQALEAGVAAAEFERLSAQLALEQLNDKDKVQLELVLEMKNLAGEQKALASAQYKVKSLRTPPPQAKLDQAHANLLLARRSLERMDDLIRIWNKRFANRKSIFWLFLDKGQFKNLLEGLDLQRTLSLRRYEDAQAKYNDLLAPPDPIDLGQAESQVSVLQAQVDESQRKIALLQNGPDPDEAAAARARLKAAETALAATQKALQDAELQAPIAGKIAQLKIKTGEWLQAGQPAIILVDDSRWVVETEDLTEIEAPKVRLGQAVIIHPNALRELELTGSVAAIKPLYVEKRGDITYTVRITLDQADPRLRWGMTVVIDFK